MSLREIAAEAFKRAMERSKTRAVDIVAQGVPEETARRVRRGQNVSLDTLEKTLAAAGFKILSLELVDLDHEAQPVVTFRREL